MKGKIFNTNEVQAIIAGTKTIFREVIKPQLPVKCPYQVGQKIFVKEEIAHGGYFGACFVYCADGTKSNKMWQTHWSRHFRPANYMNEKQSRLTLEITDIKVERLGEISEDDAIKEGIPLSNEFKDRYYTPENNYAVPKIAFMRWWNATHKKPEEKFEANPWVWAIDFEVVKC